LTINLFFGRVFDDQSGRIPQRREDYFSEVLIATKLVLRALPTPLTAVMMTIAIPAAIKPYSMAVAPESSDKNLAKFRFNKSASCL
jgi:hypothetical protein